MSRHYVGTTHSFKLLQAECFPFYKAKGWCVFIVNPGQISELQIWYASSGMDVLATERTKVNKDCYCKDHTWVRERDFAQQ